MVFVTEVTPSVAWAIDTALSASVWVLVFSAQEHRAIPVGIELNFRQSAHLFLGQFGLDLSCYHGILLAHARRGLGASTVSGTNGGRHRRGRGQEPAVLDLEARGLRLYLRPAGSDGQPEQGTKLSRIKKR